MSDDSGQLRPRQSSQDKNILDLARASIDRSRKLLLRTRLPGGQRPDSVSLTEAGGKWLVMIEENGQQPLTRSFGRRHSAFIFAEGERKRLGLVELKPR